MIDMDCVELPNNEMYQQVTVSNVQSNPGINNMIDGVEYDTVFGVADGSLNNSTTDIVPNLTSGSALGYSVSESSYFSTSLLGGPLVTPGFQVFDGDNSTEWYAAAPEINGWLKLAMPQPRAVNKYMIQSNGASTFANALFEWMPKAWSLLGSHDGISWQVLNIVSNQTNWQHGEKRYFTFINSTSFSYYQLDIVENNGSTDFLGLAEIDLIESQSAATVLVVDADINIEDIDSANIASAEIRLTGILDADYDETLTLNTTAGVASHYSLNGSHNLLSLSGNASLHDYQQILQSLAYTNTATTPSAGQRTLEIQVADSDGNNSAIKYIDINVSVNGAIYGTNVNENLYGDAQDNFIYGQPGDDRLYGAIGDDKLVGGDGIDRLYGDSDGSAIVGSGNDKLLGGNDSDFLYGQGGDDFLDGESGNDKLFGNDGADELKGGAGDDQLYGGQGMDEIYGDDGLDTIYGGDDADEVYAGAGNDKVYGEAGDDSLHGDSGDDRLYGSFGDDLLTGGAGSDRLYGDSDGASVVAAGNDVLQGGDGDDYLYAHGGDDSLYGGDGHDRMFGGDGADVFVFETSSSFNNIDVIKDYSLSQGDIIDISDLSGNFNFQQQSIYDYVSLSIIGNDSTIYVDVDGIDSVYLAHPIANLEGVSNLSLSDIVAAGGLSF